LRTFVSVNYVQRKTSIKAMELNRRSVLGNGKEVLSVREYCQQYGKGLKEQSIYYAMENDLVDYVQFGGREKYLVMTTKTKNYTPNANKKRNITPASLSAVKVSLRLRSI